MIKHLIISFLFISCDNANNSNIYYNKDLLEIYEYKHFTLPTELCLNELNNFISVRPQTCKVDINNIVSLFNDTSFDKDFLYHGYKKINNNKFYFISKNLYLQQDFYFLSKGYLVYINGNKSYLLKVFETDINNEFIITSLILNNYILVVKNEYPFDLIDEINPPEEKYQVVVLTVDNNNAITLLEKQKGIEIINANIETINGFYKNFNL